MARDAVCRAPGRCRKDHRLALKNGVVASNSSSSWTAPWRLFPDRELRVILDNLNTHKKNETWLKNHPKVHFHFIPTRSSWLNQVETRFSILQSQSLNGASFTAIKARQPTFVLVDHQATHVEPHLVVLCRQCGYSEIVE